MKKDVTGEQQKMSALAHKSKKQKKHPLILTVTIVAVLALAALVVAGITTHRSIQDQPAAEVKNEKISAEAEDEDENDSFDTDNSLMNDFPHYHDLEEINNEIDRLLTNRDYAAAIALGATSFADAEKTGDQIKIFLAKTRQATTFIVIDDKQQALKALIELIDMDVEKEWKLDKLFYALTFANNLKDTVNEKKYLEQFMQIYQSNGYEIPIEYVNRLKELQNE